MRKVLVVGSGGAGKSTFARRLGARTGLPVIHLDSLFWRPGWVSRPEDEFDAMLAEALAGEVWIIDGNYTRTLETRLAACDTVVFLDVPRRVCLFRILKRRLRFHRQSRPDVTPGCEERLDWEFLAWIWTYPRRRRPGLLRRLREMEGGKRAVIFRTAADVERFLAEAEAPAK